MTMTIGRNGSVSSGGVEAAGGNDGNGGGEFHDDFWRRLDLLGVVKLDRVRIENRNYVQSDPVFS